MKSLIVLFMVLLFSCKENKENYNILQPNQEMSKILEKFVEANRCDKCVYEIYVDKEDPHNYTTIIFVGNNSLTNEENSLNAQEAINVVFISGIKFKLYSGVEHYFKSSSPISDFKGDSIGQHDNSKTKIWVVKDSFGKFTITKRSFVYPFMTLPKPDINIDEFLIKKDHVN